jgi:hypothetical protein
MKTFKNYNKDKVSFNPEDRSVSGTVTEEDQLKEDPTLGIATAAIGLGYAAKKGMDAVQKNFNANAKRKVMKPLLPTKRT